MARQLKTEADLKARSDKLVSISDETRLANYWRDKAGITQSEFDRLTGPVPLRTNLMDRDRTIGDFRHELCVLIAQGAALYREEFYMAVAFRFLLTDLPYHEFFTTRWHETAGHYGIGAFDGSCSLCQHEQELAKKPAAPRRPRRTAPRK